MATNGSINTNSYEGRYLTFAWSVKEQNVTTNKTTISWTLKGAGVAEAKWYKAGPFKVVIDGVIQYSSDTRIYLYDGTVVASGTCSLEHNSSTGDKTFSVSVEGAIYSSSVNCKANGSWSLPNIPRKSTITASNGTLGTAQTLTVTRHSTSFTHTITYKCGSASGTIVTKSTNTSISFTPPLDLARQNTTGNSVSVVFTITTYNGSTSIGSNTKTITCGIPSAKVKPSCVISVSDSTEYLATYGSFVKGLSKFKVDILDVLSYGSPIASYSVRLNGWTYSKASFTADVISSGNVTITATVTDKRGNSSGTVTETVTVLDYAKPSISKITVVRCNQDGTENKRGAYAKVVFSSKVSPLSNKNSATYTVSIKKSTDKSYETTSLTELNGNYNVSNHEYIFEADINTSYNVKLTVTDNIDTGSATGDVSTGFTTVHYKKNGRGVGFGKVAETDDLLDIEFSTRFVGGITPILIDKGTDLNTLMTPNIYRSTSAGGDGTNANYVNCPIVASQSFVVEVLPHGTNAIVQRFTICSKEYGGIWERHYYADSWGAWRVLVNSPNLVAGTEYPISERFNNTPLYTKRINFGALPNNGSKSVSMGVSCSKITHIQVLMVNGSYLAEIPFISADGSPVVRYLVGSNGNISIQTWGNYSDYTATVIIKYYK